MKIQKKLFVASCLLIIPGIILMTLPNSLLLALVTGSPTDAVTTYVNVSYFDIKYLHFIICPLLTALFSFAWLIMSFVMIVRKKYSNVVYVTGFPSAIFSFMTIFWRGVGTIYTVIISLLLIVSFLLQVYAFKKLRANK